MYQTCQSFRESFGRKNSEYVPLTHEMHNEVVHLVGEGDEWRVKPAACMANILKKHNLEEIY